MNIIKKLYCRSFQTIFKLAIPILPYREPTILSSINELSIVFKKEKIKSILIVSDKGIIKSGLVYILLKVLKDCKVNFTIYDKTNQNPTVDNVEEALVLYKENNCEGIISIGGGSSIDCAKVIGARVVYPNKSISKMKGILKIFRKLPPLIVIPTTAGTGSEATLAAVITDKDEKYALMSFPLIPHYALLDATLTYSLPSSLTATTGMDALCHAIESYIGRSTTKETRKLAMQATKLIFENIEIAYSNPENYQARKNMLDASYKAGVAFSKSYVGYIHALAHALGGKYGTPHGLANAIIMPYVLEEYGSCIYKKLYELAVVSNICDKEDSYQVGAKKFIEAIKDLNKKMNIVSELGIKKEDIDLLAIHAEKEANPLYPVPKLMTKDELKEIYLKIGVV